jgi:hypothetical protein
MLKFLRCSLAPNEEKWCRRLKVELRMKSRGEGKEGKGREIRILHLSPAYSAHSSVSCRLGSRNAGLWLRRPCLRRPWSSGLCCGMHPLSKYQYHIKERGGKGSPSQVGGGTHKLSARKQSCRRKPCSDAKSCGTPDHSSEPPSP